MLFSDMKIKSLVYLRYNLNLTDLSQGSINVPGPSYQGRDNKIESKYECSAMDLHFVAKHAYNMDYFDRAYEFIEAAIYKAKKKEEYKNQVKSITETRGIIARDHDATLIRKGSLGEDWRTFRLPFNKTMRNGKRFKKVHHRRHNWRANILDKFSPPKRVKGPEIVFHWNQKNQLKEQFHMACRGQQMRSPLQNKRLRSFYVHHQTNYLKLGPFKLEEKSKSPFLAIFHDFFHEKELDQFIQYAQKSNMERSKHVSINKPTASQSTSGKGFAKSRKRTSKQIWAKDENSDELEFTRIVADRISIATLQDASSGIGGEVFQVR